MFIYCALKRCPVVVTCFRIGEMFLLASRAAACYVGMATSGHLLGVLPLNAPP
jgi:hypothetical protein